MTKVVIPKRIQNQIERVSKSKPKSRELRLKTEAEIEEEEIFNPLNKPEFEESLKWLKDILDFHIWKRQPNEYYDEPGTHDIILKPNCEASKFALDKQEFHKLLKWMMFEEPNDQHEYWFIPMDLTREQLVLQSNLIKDILHSNEMLNSKGIDFQKCKGCNWQFINLQLHLNKKPNCKSSYSEADMEQLNELLKHMSKARRSAWYLENKERLSKQKSKYYQENQDRILKKMKQTAKERKKQMK